MGQQQLLLIIAGVVIIGLAVLVGVAMFQDNAIDHNRSVVIADLKTLASKAQHYYSRPMTMGGGNNSFVGLTADAWGIGLLAGTAFTNNANGTCTDPPPGRDTNTSRSSRSREGCLERRYIPDLHNDGGQSVLKRLQK